MSALYNNRPWLIITLFAIAAIFVVMSVLITAKDGKGVPNYKVRVVDFYPQGVVDRPTNITVKFSNDLMPDDSLDKVTTSIPFEIEPPISGLARWIDNDEIRFFPDTLLAPSTIYKIKFKNDLSFMNGNRIDEKKTFEFSTPVFIVKRITTRIEDVPDMTSQIMLTAFIEFNYAVDYDSLIAHLKSNLRPYGENLEFSSDKRESSTRFMLVSDHLDRQHIEGDDFVLTVKKGLTCIGGQLPLQADIRKEFSIEKPPPLVVERVHPETSGKNGRILVQLSHRIELGELQEYLNITPAVKITLDQRYKRHIYLYGNFKPQEVYTIEIIEGLKATNGRILERTFSTKVQMPDLNPSLKFLDDGFYMSKRSNKLLAVETINMDEITVEVEQIFANNIVHYLNTDSPNRYRRSSIKTGRKIFAKDYVIPSVLNEPIVSTFNLGEVVGDSLQGIYSVSIRRKDRRWDYSNRRIMITDLGILAKLSDNYLMVWVNSLEDLQPVKQAEIKLLSDNNQILIEGKTNSEGVALFEDIGAKLIGFTPFVITVNKDSDMSYLKFSECILPSAEFDISGRPFLSKGYETFIYSDRGVYRPGETVHLVSVVRGKNGILPEEFPYILYLTDPRGYEFKKFKLNTSNKGLETIDVDIPSFAKTGAYNVTARIDDKIIGQYSFQVEEFMPDRIKTTLAVDKKYYRPGEELQLTINGTYLFGTPCQGNKVNGKIIIEQNLFRPSSYSEYSFVDPGKKFTSMKIDLQTDTLDKTGNHIYSYSIPENLYPSSNLKILLSGTVLEDGGRAVSDYNAVILHPYSIYLGLKKNFEGYANVGDDVEYSLTAVDVDGNFINVDSVWAKLYKIIYHTIVKKGNSGIYRYVSEEQEHLTDSVLVSLAKAHQTAKFSPQEYGAYRIRLESPYTKHTSSSSFYVSGWGYSPWSMTNPDRLELELDSDRYRRWQKAKLLVKAPFEGKLLLTIEQDKIIKYQTYNLDSNTAEIEIEVSSKYAPNVYISGTLIKSITSLERFSPTRAFGIIPLIVENDEAKIEIKLETASPIKPQQKIDIKIKSVPHAMLTVAAVDAGILQLTDFTTPDPYEFFYGKRRLSLNAYDIYSFIFPDVKPGESMLSPSGDADLYELRRKRHVSPITSKRVKPVVLWSGLIKTDSLGNALVNFDIPQFNGQLKIMVVGFDDTRCGSATGEIIVKDKILIQESLPRFLTSGDQIDARVVVFNNTGKDDTIAVSMDVVGPASIKSDKTVYKYIVDGGKETIHFLLNAEKYPGNVSVNISAVAGENISNVKVEIPNRPPQPLTTIHGSGIVKEGEPAAIRMPSNWLEGTAEYQLRISSIPTVRLSNSIQYLLSYPYGCLEQTTSRLFPMLYYDDLAQFAQSDLVGSKGTEYFIQEGLIRILGMQLPAGDFTYWPDYNRKYHWVSIYACHFLVEARKAGYYISDDVFNKIYKYLKKTANNSLLENNRGILRIYAAYVLALAGKLDRGTLEGLKYLNLDELPLYSKFMYGGAIALTKSPEDALWLIPIEIHPVNIEPETGNLFNSSVRANAILLDILTEIAPNNPSIPVLLESISEELRIGRWYTTQSTAWGLMAIGKYLRTREKADYMGSIVINGKKYTDFDLDNVIIKDKILENNEIEISINGTGNCYYYWQASGISAETQIQEYDDRLIVRREYLDAKGNSLKERTLKPGDQVVARITAQAMDKSLENVVINDLLPACFEIENPRLATSGRMDWTRDKSSKPDYLDIRDDRMLLFVGLKQDYQFTHYYSLRVIASGDFIVPPVAAECMYDPPIKSAGSSGKIRIAE
jgi:hypothetical protein